MRKFAIGFTLGLVLTLCLSAVAAAQQGQDQRGANLFRGSLLLGTGSLAEYGFNDPYIELGLSAEFEGRHFWTSVSGLYSPTDKTGAETSGANYRLSAFGVLSNGLMFGGGVGESSLQSSEQGWKKSDQRPFAAVGWRSPSRRVRAWGAYVLPDDSDPYGLESYKLFCRFDFTPNFSAGGEYVSSRGQASTGPLEATGFIATFSVFFDREVGKNND